MNVLLQSVVKMLRLISKHGFSTLSAKNLAHSWQKWAVEISSLLLLRTNSLWGIETSSSPTALLASFHVSDFNSFFEITAFFRGSWHVLLEVRRRGYIHRMNWKSTRRCTCANTSPTTQTANWSSKCKYERLNILGEQRRCCCSLKHHLRAPTARIRR